MGAGGRPDLLIKQGDTLEMPKTEATFKIKWNSCTVNFVLKPTAESPPERIIRVKHAQKPHPSILMRRSDDVSVTSVII